MREIELKIQVEDYLKLKKELDSRYSSGKIVAKKDQYFIKNPDSVHQDLRVRNNCGKVEITTKKKDGDDNALENNLEYELSVDSSFENTVEFFSALGFYKYFIKEKNGWEWTSDDSIHIELLKVNDIGWFFEIEMLIPFDLPEIEINASRKKLINLIHSLDLNEKDICNKSYRSMIIGK